LRKRSQSFEHLLALMNRIILRQMIGLTVAPDSLLE
jgi:hypothetical protein